MYSTSTGVSGALLLQLRSRMTQLHNMSIVNSIASVRGLYPEQWQ
jgi:hypothetical protein